MPTHGSYDKITSPARENYRAPAKVNTQAPGIWESTPARGKGIPGKYSYPGSQGPTGPAPQFKV